ncbi:MAG: hypothetical protein CVV58_00340 [Tenericutes bacterium HGW-Tenericutes-3]|jgi:hypothetical protein|nr:MAG: hypothetical protein CVV58_00340 [Tenericutes bacterium HGW-Tenericutes-3]
MKSLKSKVILSAVVLIFALVATIGSTFAWFTVSNTVATSNISLNVISADSLLIKLANYTAADGDATAAAQLNPANYSQSATINDTTLDAAGYIDLGASESMDLWQLGLVTAVQPGYATVTANPAELRTMVTAVATNPDRELSAGAYTGFNSQSGGAIQLKFWVMSQSSANKYLRVNELLITGTTASTEVNTALQNSMRVSVYSSVATVGNSYLFMKDLAGASYDYSFAFTSANADTFYAGSVYPTDIMVGFNYIDQLTLGINGASTALTAAALASQKLGTSTSNITTLVQNVPQLVTVTYFIEGWDAQASDLLNTATFQTSFRFTIVNA